MNEETRISLERADILKHKIDDYMFARKSISRGLELEDVIQGRKKKILSILNGTEDFLIE